MNNNRININEVVISDYFTKGKSKVLYIYSLTAFLAAGYGYISISDYTQKVQGLTGKSKKTAERWITLLKENKLIRIRKGVIYPNSISTVELGHDVTQTYIRFYEEQLKSYSNFQLYVIRQVAYLLQRRFKHAWKHLSTDDAASLVNAGKIEAKIARLRSRSQVGCSISKVQNKLGVEKMLISKALKGYTRKQWNTTGWIKGTIARVKYGDMFNDMAGDGYLRCLDRTTGETFRVMPRYMDPRWSFDYDAVNDMYLIKYALASLIVVDGNLCRKR